MKLRTVALNNSIMWMGHSSTQLTAAGGTTLELMEKLRVVIATPAQISDKRPVKIIPLENIKEMEELSEAALAAQAKEREALEVVRKESAQRTEAKQLATKSALKGITKFEKDPVTGAIVEKQI